MKSETGLLSPADKIEHCPKTHTFSLVGIPASSNDSLLHSSMPNPLEEPLRVTTPGRKINCQKTDGGTDIEALPALFSVLSELTSEYYRTAVVETTLLESLVVLENEALYNKIKTVLVGKVVLRWIGPHW
jgi:hypothetical protein